MIQTIITNKKLLKEQHNLITTTTNKRIEHLQQIQTKGVNHIWNSGILSKYPKTYKEVEG